MSKFVSDGIIQVRLHPGVSNRAAPTEAEWGAAVDLTPFMRALDTPLEGSSVDSATAESRYNKTTSGTYGGQALTGEFTRDDVFADDDAWTALARTTTGDLLVARRGGTDTDGAVQSGDHIDVWPIEVMARVPIAYARNELARFTISCAVPEEPVEDVAVAA